MPELPEVETIRKQLSGAIEDRTLVKIEVLRGKSFVGNEEKLIGKSVLRVKRKSKILIIEFEGGVFLMIHLKMTGQLIFVDKNRRIVGGHPTPDWVSDLPSKHTRVVLYFKDGSKLFFNDMRVFGWMKIVDKKLCETITKNLPPDITDKDFTKSYLFNLLKNSQKPVKLVLLDQDKLGGLGNIYVNDALFKSKIMPTRKANSLSKKEVGILWSSVIEVIMRGIESGGASSSNYVQLTGLGGTYQKHFLVYKRNGMPCVRCKTLILKSKIGGRGTFFCPNCQK